MNAGERERGRKMLKTERPLKVVAVLFGFAIASGFQLELG